MLLIIWIANKKMKKLILLLLFIPLVFSCSGSEDDNALLYPSLTITNQNSIISIHTVSLVGYKFENLSIGLNQSKTFSLSNGIDGGLDNVNVIAQWSCGGKNNWSTNKSITFKKGGVTTATLVSSFQNGGGGCRDVLLE